MNPRKVCRPAAALLLGVSAGCTPPGSVTDAQNGKPMEPGKHWVQDAHLRRVMSTLVKGHAWPEGVDEEQNGTAEQVRRRALADAVELSGGLARAAEDIPRTVANVSMSPADRLAFGAQARLLGEQATALRRSARGGDVEDMRRILDEIGMTCSSCHNRFRDFSGLLGPRDAAAKQADSERLAVSIRPG